MNPYNRQQKINELELRMSEGLDEKEYKEVESQLYSLITEDVDYCKRSIQYLEERRLGYTEYISNLITEKRKVEDRISKLKDALKNRNGGNDFDVQPSITDKDKDIKDLIGKYDTISNLIEANKKIIDDYKDSNSFLATLLDSVENRIMDKVETTVTVLGKKITKCKRKKIVIIGEPNEEDGPFVKVETKLSWDRKEIKAQLDNGEPLSMAYMVEEEYIRGL